ncbi:LPS assembly lipoprotein LptE [Mucilaginibacter roseus]|uniref:LPS assembly lipoprotein LptE n=1 Tax=Mucilaginibacter roseus TaxID=1528868 RepID=A0ABS8U1C3_9SPHI|nr:LptE family protein [Mucilaginibacter roseus]MCD8740920.1 LPS assembly lipoprotein LptE [Mucilaginibacter roseus]
MRRVLVFFVAMTGLMLLSQSCSISLNGASIPAGLKTINVEFFENNAPLVVSNLSQDFTEALKARIRSQSSLGIVRDPAANASMSGAIVNYTITPVSVEATNPNTPPIANASRLSITVNVKYTNEIEKKYNFEQQFTKYQDFQGDIASQEQTLIQNIVRQLVDDIFNKAFANW